MSRTLTALFDSRDEAEAAKSRLQAASIDISRVDIHSGGTDHAGTGSSSGGFFSGLKHMILPDEDRHTYEEGMRRGGAVLTAQVDEGHEDEAVRILEEAKSIDIDERSQSWRSTGWNPAGAATASAAVGAVPTAGGRDRGIGVGNSVDEERIQLVEEELRIGKREVDRGGVRVRSYVVEQPVHEQVSLREEHVEVERRPVNQTLGRADADAFQERTIEMTESLEEAVVDKQARVREELVIRKDVETHVEQIDDTVRKTEVEVDDLGSTGRDKDRF